ncbi:FUSC family protein [Cupriavidus metallidurans]|uniref:Fusaric acid resistance protein conserved region/ multidrug efflux system component n=1 Tax=Cupriavidus metallidurans (strain ATCC 43123 / DSM 2839 / NBRC 102507 / CH34) TaxID=266264 RepID=Q1LEQ0_CUPMC|nr:FUSC family protein [Cupriavidus metallidurans]ABF11376.1 Fusaric acid resistance protein conserved region/ multidrug efflux system component [Cupriavidus metallidurans CH34]QGS33290.1 FUSC family protein [Cupriavidus metallidurans]
MAQPAADKLRLGLGDIGALLAPTPGRAAATTRITVASVLTVLVTAIYGTPEAAISAYVIFFINREDRTVSIVMSVAALVLVSLIIGLVIVLANFSVDDSLRRLAFMAVLSAALLFLTSASKLRPIGAIVAMIIGFGLDELGLVPGGEAATRALLYAWLMVAIPIGVNVAVNLVMGPSPRRLAGDRLAHCLRMAAASLRQEDAAPAMLVPLLRDGTQPVGMWLKLAKIEGLSRAEDLAALRRAAASTTAILIAADMALRQPNARLPAAFRTPIADTLDQMAAMLQAGGYPVEITLALPALESLAPVQQAIAVELRDAIVGFTDADAPSAQANAALAEAPNATEEKKGGFLSADAFTNPEHIRYALKTTGAAMFCYVLYQQLNWPGIHTCFITVYLVSLSTAAETVEKLSLRLAGCLIGALIGTAALVYVVPSIDSVGGLLMLVFTGTWVAAWVAQGSPRISYAGFQIAFAFYLCVIQGAGPGYDLTIARDRTIGIVIGNLVTFLVFTRIWPVSISGRIEAALHDMVRQWRQLIATPRREAQRQNAAAALALHGAITQDLILARYEPALVGPGTDWIEARQRHLATLDAVAGPLFLLAERFPGDPEVDRRLQAVRMDGHAPVTSAAPLSPQHSPRDALLALVDRHLAAPRQDDPPAAATGSPLHA